MLANPGIDLIQGGIEFSEDILVADYFKPGQLINLRQCVTGATFFSKRKVFADLGGFKHMTYGKDTDFRERAQQSFTLYWITGPETYVCTRAEQSVSKEEVTRIHNGLI